MSIRKGNEGGIVESYAHCDCGEDNLKEMNESKRQKNQWSTFEKKTGVDNSDDLVPIMGNRNMRIG